MRTKPCPKIERCTTAFAKARFDPFRPPLHKQAGIPPRGKFLVLTPSTPHPGLAFTTGTSSCSTIGTNCRRLRGMHNAANCLANTSAAGGCQRARSFEQPASRPPWHRVPCESPDNRGDRHYASGVPEKATWDRITSSDPQHGVAKPEPGISAVGSSSCWTKALFT